MQPRILFLDIETAPNMGYIWGLWQKTYSTEMIAQDWYILCWCAKWYKENGMICSSLPDHPIYKTDPTNDKAIMHEMWELLNEADIVVAHNAVKFDIKKINTRFMAHKMKPPSPYKVVDTLKMARRHFAFTSNKLDDLGKMLNLGRKEDTGGFQLWIDCLAGKTEAWKKMVKYCAGDVRLLEKIYSTLLPYASNMPNINVYTEEFVCPKCGSAHLQKRGWTYTSLCKYQRWVCCDCGSWSRERKSEKQNHIILANA